MVELISITKKIVSIEADLSVIMQLLRVASTTEGYEITSQGLDELSGMVFAASLRVSSLALDVGAFASMNRDLLDASKKYVAAVKSDERDIAELVALARQSVRFIKQGDSDGWGLLARCLDSIEKRVAGEPEPERSNVVLFVRPTPQADALEGGAA